MDEKFSLNDIAQLLAEQAGVDLSKSESLINGLVEIVNEGIRKDGIVKIKGFGTFKIILVKERESIHVNTGERILIPAHHKLSFKPDDDLKELINRPFSIFETIEDTNEIADKTEEEISSIPESNTPEKPELNPEEEEQLISDPQIIDDEPNESLSDINKADKEVIAPPTIMSVNQDEEPKNIPPPPPPVKGEDKPITKTNVSDDESETPWITNKIREENAPPTQEKISKPNTPIRRKKKKSSLLPLYIILGILILISIGCVWYYFSYTRSFDSFVSDNYSTRVSNDFALPGDTTQVAPENTLSSKDSIATKTDTLPKKEIASPQTNAATEKREAPSTSSSSTPKPPAATKPSASKSSGSTNKVLAEVTMESGNRLTLLALKYYGSKIFWVYIYDYNKDKIGSNPDNVKAGMKILIPAKEVYGIDVNDANSREKARKLQTELMSGKK